MLERVRRLFQADPLDPYVREVASILIREGFNPRDLDEMSAAATFTHSSRLFQVPKSRRLPPADAAHAIQLTMHLYRTTRHVAETRGWPLRDESIVAQGCPRNEAYFLELLAEAVRRCDSTFRPRNTA